MTKSKMGRRKRRLINDVVSDGGRQPLDRVLEALSRETDRYILYYLHENGSATFDELVDGVIAVGADEPPITVSDTVRREIRTNLHHKRLPKLEDLGIVEYDQRNGSVCYRNPPPHFRDFLQLARDLDDY